MSKQEFIPKEVILEQVKASMQAELEKAGQVIKGKSIKNVKDLEWTPDGIIIIYK